MASWPWMLLLCVVAAAAGSVFQAGAQPDDKGTHTRSVFFIENLELTFLPQCNEPITVPSNAGFISIDCGLQGETGYGGDSTIWYVPDAGFTDAGTNHIITSEFVSPSMAKSWHSLRRFADGMRNCYTLGFLMAGLKYLIRARFMYGNYDGLNQPPVFDLHIGVNYWHTVNISTSKETLFVEAIVVVTDDFVQVCLVNTGDGTPFISGLELRPLKMTLYPQATTAQGLVLLDRLNVGSTDRAVVRYPDDPHDRIWIPWVNTIASTEISTEKKVQITEDDLFEVPTTVMQTAISPRNGFHGIELSWDSEPQPQNPSPGYFIILHFSELQLLPSNRVRQFYVNLNGEPLYPSGRGVGFTPRYLYTGATYNRLPFQQSNYNITIDTTATSTMPPILNAVEVFSVIPTTNVGTDSRDGTYVMQIISQLTFFCGIRK